MGEHPNAALYREIHQKLEAGDWGAMFDYLADDVVWHQIGAESLRGKEAVQQTMSSMGELPPGGFTIELHDVVGNDDHVVALVEATVRMGDESFSYRTAEIAHVRDGKVTERWAFSDDTQRISDFFSTLAG